MNYVNANVEASDWCQASSCLRDGQFSSGPPPSEGERTLAHTGKNDSDSARKTALYASPIGQSAVAQKSDRYASTFKAGRLEACSPRSDLRCRYGQWRSI
jgi:hypothetical protein